MRIFRKIVYESRALVAELLLGLALEIMMPKGEDKLRLTNAVIWYFEGLGPNPSSEPDPR